MFLVGSVRVFVVGLRAKVRVVGLFRFCWFFSLLFVSWGCSLNRNLFWVFCGGVAGEGWFV